MPTQAAQHLPLPARHLSDFDPGPTQCRAPSWPHRPVDSAARRDLAARCRVWYEDFEFHKVYHSVYAFATVDLSAVYFDILKDRLYTAATKSPARRSAQTALYRLLDRAGAADGAADELHGRRGLGHMGRTESVHIACFPEPSELTAGFDDAARQCAQDWDRLMEVRRHPCSRAWKPRATRSSSARRSKRACASRPAPIYTRCSSNTPANCGAVHRFPSCARSRRHPECPSGTRGRPEVRALLEVHYRHRRRHPVSHHLRSLRRGRGRDLP